MVTDPSPQMQIVSALFIDEIGDRHCDVGIIVAAAMYHDAVYEPKSPANGRASARLAHRDLVRFGWAADRIGRVGAMIEGTATHTDAPDLDTAVLFDADLSILGADDNGYAAYVAAVRDEYRHVDDDAWATGRLAVLCSLLERDAIYSTEPGIGRWESSARSNLGREIADLSVRVNGAGAAPESE